MSSPNAASRSRTWQQVALFIVTLAVFLRAGQCGFVNYDDPQYVYENPHVKTGLSYLNLAWAFSALHGDVSYWHPLTWVSHQLDSQLFGLNPGLHHLTSVWIHVANTLLLFAVLARLGLPSPVSFLTAGLFALHPLHVESVAWISERKDVLCGFFWLAALLMYLRFREKLSPGFYAAALGFFLLALMSKPMAVSLPVVLALLEWTSRRARNNEGFGLGGNGGTSPVPARSILLRLTPFFLFSLGAGVVTCIAQAKVGALQSLAVLPLFQRLGNAFVSYVTYLRRTVWPDDLCVSYVHPGFLAPGAVTLAILVLFLITWYAVKLRRRAPLIIFGWLFFLVTLLPTIGLVQVGIQALADRYAYLPLIGVLLIVSWIPFQFLSKHRHPALFNLLVVAALLACAALSFRQLAYWRDSIALFQRAVEVDPRNWVARLGLGMALTQERRFDEALVHLKSALQWNQNGSEVHKKIGVSLYRKGDAHDAFQHWETALALNPTRADVCFLMANALATHPDAAVRDGRLAVEYAEKGHALKPALSLVDLMALSAAYAEAGEFKEAIRYSDLVIERGTQLRDQEAVQEASKRRQAYARDQAFYVSLP